MSQPASVVNPRELPPRIAPRMPSQRDQRGLGVRARCGAGVPYRAGGGTFQRRGVLTTGRSHRSASPGAGERGLARCRRGGGIGLGRVGIRGGRLPGLADVTRRSLACPGASRRWSWAWSACLLRRQPRGAPWPSAPRRLVPLHSTCRPSRQRLRFRVLLPPGRWLRQRRGPEQPPSRLWPRVSRALEIGGLLGWSRLSCHGDCGALPTCRRWPRLRRSRRPVRRLVPLRGSRRRGGAGRIVAAGRSGG